MIEGDAEFIATNPEDSSRFFLAASKLITEIEKQSSSSPFQASVLKQTLTSWLEWVKYEIDQINEVEVKVQNPRDLQMARNLIYLANLYPGKKITAWGASYHFANEIQLYKNSPLTKLLGHRLDSLQKSESPSDLDKDLDGAVPMGRILKQHFGNSLYSLAFSSFEGEFGMLGMSKIPLKPIEPPKGSIEHQLVQRHVDNAWIDFNLSKTHDYIYSSALGNLPVLAPWSKIFDGLFFIRKSFAPSFSTDNTTSGQTVSNQERAQPRKIKSHIDGLKKLIDKKTGEGISYANISLLNSSKGVSTNLQGEFVFNLPGAKATDRIVLSSIGYKTDTILFQDLAKLKEITLTPKVYELAEVVIRSKPLSAREILKRAEKKVKDNFYQLPHQQEFFYRTKNY